MADILRVTTPLTSTSNANMQPRTTAPDTASVFSLQDPQRVIHTHNQSELQQQNTGLLAGEETPSILMSLLRDPAVAVSYLKSLSTMEEIFRLVPANNKALSAEVEQMFSAILLNPDDVVAELLTQQQQATSFRGELFDFLRGICDAAQRQENGAQNAQTQGAQEGAFGVTSGTETVYTAVATLLKAINSAQSRSDILDAIANGLGYLRENLSASDMLSSELDSLIAQFKSPQAAANFPQLKTQVQQLMRSIQGNLLNNPKLEKTLSMMTYNLSRFNSSNEFVSEAAYRLRSMLPEAQQQKLIDLVNEYFMTNDRNASDRSQVMDNLTSLIRSSAQNEESLNSAAKTDAVLQSLLSSPCNFTPLLHFIVPMQFEDLNAFSEIWINPEHGPVGSESDGKSGTHLLMVIDIEGSGRFEAEFFVADKTVDFLLLTPAGLENSYAPLSKAVPKILAHTDYKAGQMRVEPLTRPRSLMDVFKNLPYKRMGVDVKV